MKSKKPEARFPDLTSEATSGFFASGALVIGVDEVGRGCLAGPVVAGAVALDAGSLSALGFPMDGARPDQGTDDHPFLRVRDSKLIPEVERAPLRDAIEPLVKGWSVAEASVEEIARLNILHASGLAMERAVSELETRLGRKADRVLVDGNRVPLALRDRGQAIVKGDLKSLSIAAASLFAKVHRDALMEELEGKHPGYGFLKHKGYPTPFHQARIRELGVTPVHRKGFKGVGPA
jgi:ribonuclease HII